MGLWLVHGALAALPLACLALVVERVFRRRPALAHLVWLLVLVRLVAPPLAFERALEPPAPAGAPALVDSAPSLGHELVGALTRTFGGRWSDWLAPLGLALWSAGAVTVLGREARRASRTRRALRAARPASAAERARVAAVARRLGVAPPRVCVLPGIASPFVWPGPWSGARGGGGTLVLTDGAPAHEAVIAHELAHLRRRDGWVAGLELLILALCWWNPLAWLARRRLRLQAELACDACALRHYPREARRYARVLVEALESACVATEESRGRAGAPMTSGTSGTSGTAGAIGALGAIGWSARELEARLRRILAARDQERLPRGPALGLVAAFVLSLPGVGTPSLAQLGARLPGIPNGLDRAGARTLLAESEAALATDPCDEAAHDRRARALMGLGRFGEAAQVWSLALERAAGSERAARAAYNLACARSLEGQEQEALTALRRALELGMSPAVLPLDPDLAPLRELEAFRALCEEPAVTSVTGATGAR